MGNLHMAQFTKYIVCQYLVDIKKKQSTDETGMHFVLLSKYYIICLHGKHLCWKLVYKLIAYILKFSPL